MQRYILGTLLLLPLFCLSQERVQVNIVDENDQPIIGSSCYSKDLSHVFESDNHGQLFIPKKILPLQFFVEAFSFEKDSFYIKKQRVNPITIELSPLSRYMKTLLVLGRASEKRTAIAGQIAVLDQAEINKLSPQTSVDGLAKTSTAFIQKSQMGGGSPILRGFEANKLLLVVDGVRMNNAIYRSGHLQNAITVDPSILDRTEVVLGPGALLYGSDALGGVIHFKTKQPSFSPDSIFSQANYRLQWASANQEKTAHAHVEIAKNKWASLTSFSISRFEDLITGSRRNSKYPNFGKRSYYVDPNTDEIIKNKNENKQVGTGYSQFDFTQKFNYRLTPLSFINANIQLSSSSDIPRYDELISLEGDTTFNYSEWYYGPQKRMLVSLKYDVANQTNLYDRAEISLALQNVEESRHSRGFRSDQLQNNTEQLNVYSFNADLEKSLNKNLGLRYGMEWQYNNLNSQASADNIVTGEPHADAILSRYPSENAKMLQGGLYARLDKKINRWRVELGGRLGYNKIDVEWSEQDPIQWPTFFYEGVQNASLAFAWASKLEYIGRKYTWNIHTGSAFRSPNIDDFAKTRVKNNAISIPNTNLERERTWNIEMGIQRRGQLGNQESTYSFGGTLYYTFLDDAIVRENSTLPDGSSAYILEGRELQVQSNTNAQRGYIYGLGLQANIDILHSIQFGAAINYQYGRAKDGEQKTPLAHIPPLFGHLQLGVTGSRWSALMHWQFNGAKKIKDYAPGSSDNEIYATVDGSPAWNTLNFSTQMSFSRAVKLHVGIDNIFDTHYRSFSSGVSAPGRNFIIGLNGSF